MYEYNQYEDDNNNEQDVNELQLIDELGRIPLKQIESSIKSFDRMVKQLKPVFELEEVQNDPFVEVEYRDVKDVYSKIRPMLEECLRYAILLQSGHLLFKSDDFVAPANINLAGIDEHSPAYRYDIDNNKIYNLWKEGISIRKIAKQVGCSPDTVKRRILRMEHKDKG